MSDFDILATEILHRSLDAIVVVDEANCILCVNPAFCNLTEYPMEALDGRSFAELFPIEKKESLALPLFMQRGEGTPTQKSIRELELQTSKGYLVPVEMRAFSLPIESGAMRYAGILRDIRDRKRLEDQKNHLIQRLKELAFVDELTMLPNRRAFFDSMHKAVATARRRNRETVVGVLDIDFFKTINDTYGHDVGDMVLRKISGILTDNLREEDVVGRIGGEEFGCILPDTDLE